MLNLLPGVFSSLIISDIFKKTLVMGIFFFRNIEE